MKKVSLISKIWAIIGAGFYAVGLGFLSNGVLTLTGATATQMTNAYQGIAQGGLDIFAFLVNSAQDLIVLGFAISFGLLFLFRR